MTAAVFAEWGKYAARILNGTKRFEYRKRLAARRLDVIYVYEVAPVSAVVGMVEVVAQGYEPELDLWARTCDRSGMSRAEWEEYTGADVDTPIAYYELANPVRFPKPIPLDYFGIAHTPQSFAYVPADLAIGQMRLDEVLS